MVQVYDSLNLKIISNDETSTGKVVLETINRVIIEGFILVFEYQTGPTDNGFELAFDCNFRHPKIAEIESTWFTFPQATSQYNVEPYKKVLLKGTYNMFLPIPLPAPADYVKINFQWLGTFTGLGTVKFGMILNAFRR